MYVIQKYINIYQVKFFKCDVLFLVNIQYTWYTSFHSSDYFNSMSTYSNTFYKKNLTPYECIYSNKYIL